MWKMFKKYRILLSLELIVIFACFLFAFQKDELIFTQVGDDLTIEYTEENGISDSEKIQLLPGVYQLRIHADIQTQGYAFWTVLCEESSFKALRCNGAHIYSEQEYLDFEVYVFDKIDTAYIHAQLTGVDQFSFESIELYRTSMGARIFTVVAIFLSVLINFFVWFRKKSYMQEISKKKQLAFWMLFGAVIIVFSPYATDYYNLGADSAFHLLRIEGLKESILDGIAMPIRVQSYWLYGHGYAVSSFYSDFFFFIPALLRIVGFSLMAVYKVYLLIVIIAIAIVSYFSFRLCTKDEDAALFGSMIYTLSPYFIYNIYNRGAVGEYTAMVFLPLIMAGIYGLFHKEYGEEHCVSKAEGQGFFSKMNYNKMKVLLIIGLTGLLQCHILTTEMIVVFIVLFCIVFWKRTFIKQTFIQLAEAAVITLLLNCWFWLPMLKLLREDQYKLSSIISKKIQENGTYFAEIFQLFPNKGGAQTGMYNAEPFQIGIAVFMMLCILGIVLGAKFLFKRSESCKKSSLTANPYEKIMKFLAFTSLFLLFMSTKYFPWNFLADIPMIGYLAKSIQFPTRMLSPTTASCALFASYFTLWFRWECEKVEKSINDNENSINKKLFANILPAKECKLIYQGVLCILMMLAIGTAVYHVNDIAFEREAVRLYNAENMGGISVVNGEYLLEGDEVLDYYSHGPVADIGLEWRNYKKTGTEITIHVDNSTNTELYLELPLTGYKGYSIENEAQEENFPYIDEQRGAHGDLRVVVPAGYAGDLRIWYKGFGIFKVAEIISLITILGIVGYLLYQFHVVQGKKGRRGGKEQRG